VQVHRRRHRPRSDRSRDVDPTVGTGRAPSASTDFGGKCLAGVGGLRVVLQTVTLSSCQVFYKNDNNTVVACAFRGSEENNVKPYRSSRPAIELDRKRAAVGIKSDNFLQIKHETLVGTPRH